MPAPNAPSNLVALALTASRVDLTWQDNSSDEANFELEQSPNGTTGWALIASPVANATTHSVTGLATNTTYYWRIRAVNIDGNSAYSNTISALTLLIGLAPIVPRLYILQPATVFAARVNLPAATYPIDTIPFDGVTTGAYTDISAGMTVLIGSAAGLNDLGEQRVRLTPTLTLLYVGRSSRGTHPGELTATDNAYITVLNERLPWAKMPYIAPDGTIYKDSDLVVATYTTNPPPVAVAQASFAATIVAGVITVLLNGQSSFATADSATITTYAWDIDDGTLLSGTLADDNISCTFPAGYRYISLTVTDSNDNTHTTYRLIYARDPAADTSIPIEIESHSISEAGQRLTVRALTDIPRSSYRERAPCLVWEREPNATNDRDHMLIVGYLHDEPQSVQSSRVGNVRTTSLQILDIAGKLDIMPGLPQSLANDSTRDTGLIPAITWSYMVNPTLDKYIHYLLHWHSTALEIADFTWTDTGNLYQFLLLKSDGDSLWNQIDRRARAFLPDYCLTCDRRGRIAIVPDPMLRDAADRTSVVLAAIDESEYSSIQFSSQPTPRTHWLRGSAIVAGTTQPIQTVFSIAPGNTPGQGLGEISQGEQLAIGQAALNAATGHRYARSNAPYSLLRLTLIQNDDGASSFVPWREIEPAYKEWVTIDMSAAVSPQRGVVFDTVRALPKEINIRYNRTRYGLQRTVELVAEAETVGEPGVTVVKPVIPPVGGVPTFTPPAPGDPAYYYDDIKAYILWDGAHVLRTWDLQAASPVWAWVSSGIDGNILDAHYVHVSATTIGMWLMTDTAIWWCADIMATTPAWEEVLPIEDVIAADVAPSVGTVKFGCCFPYWSEPGYLCVATTPTEDVDDYTHAYFWHTHDYGQTWTQVDAGSLTYTADPEDPVAQRYSYTNVFSMNIFRSAPGTIWCMRATNRLGIATGDTAILRSHDLGHTWLVSYNFLGTGGEAGSWSARHKFGSILNPFPSITDPAYAIRGRGATSAPHVLYRSSAGFTNAIGDVVEGVAAAGYTSIFSHSNQVQRANKRTFDNTHVMAVWDGTTRDLLESYDQGATWSVLKAGLPNSVMTPNGWPVGTEEQWILIYSNDTPRIQLTLDHFATAMLDKTGDLVTVLASATPVGWINGLGSGVALPRLGPNA